VLDPTITFRTASDEYDLTSYFVCTGIGTNIFGDQPISNSKMQDARLNVLIIIFSKLRSIERRLTWNSKVYKKL